MDMHRMTLKVQEALQSASALAMRRNHQGIDVEHVLAALLEQADGLTSPIIEQAGIAVSAAKASLVKALDRVPQVQVSGSAPVQIHLTQRTANLLANAENERQALKDEYVSVEHMLLGMTRDCAVLKKLGITRDKLLSGLQKVRGNQRVTSQDPEGIYLSLIHI